MFEEIIGVLGKTRVALEDDCPQCEEPYLLERYRVISVYPTEIVSVAAKGSPVALRKN